MTALVIGVLGLGAAFSVLAAVGIVRMPDVYTRMQASSKAGTLGATLVLAGVAVAFADAAVATRAVLAIAFVLLTGPVAAHVLGRAAYRSGVAPAPETRLDELKEHGGATPPPEEGPDPSG